MSTALENLQQCCFPDRCLSYDGDFAAENRLEIIRTACTKRSNPIQYHVLIEEEDGTTVCTYDALVGSLHAAER